MAKKVAGVDVILKVDVDGEKKAIGGQKGASLSRSAETIDISDKVSGGWAESMMGLKSWSLECEGFVCLGDEGFNKLHEAFDDRLPLEVEIKVGGTDGYTYTGSVVITDFPEEYPMDDAVTYSVSLQGASPLVKKANNLELLSKAKTK